MAAIFFDLSKAFDTVPHLCLLQALSNVGVSGRLHDWFKSYLTGRSQCVVLDGMSSLPISVGSGVPQGSILGPLLFLIYSDQLCSLQLSVSTSLQLYADDILLFKPFKSVDDLVSLQDDIHSISSTVHQLGLRLNASKTKLLVISRKRLPPTLSLTVNNQLIQQAKSVTYLGVQISSDLTWAAHIDALCSKAKRQIGTLHRHFHTASPRVLTQLYKSLVLPTVDYCSSLWDPHFSVHSNKLESVQKFAARLVTRNWRGNYDELLLRLQWPTLSVRRRKQKVALCYRILNNCSIIPSSFFTPHPSPHLRHNHSLPLYYPPIRSTSHLSSFSVSVVPIWNCLPSDIAAAPPSIFKQRLKLLPFL